MMGVTVGQADGGQTADATRRDVLAGFAGALAGGLAVPPGRAALAALAPADLVLRFTVPARKA